MRDTNPYRFFGNDASTDRQTPTRPASLMLLAAAMIGVFTTPLGWSIMQANYLGDPVPNLWDDALLASLFYVLGYAALAPIGLLLNRTLGRNAASMFDSFIVIVTCLSPLALAMPIWRWTGPVRLFS